MNELHLTKPEMVKVFNPSSSLPFFSRNTIGKWLPEVSPAFIIVTIILPAKHIQDLHLNNYEDQNHG